MVVPFSSPLTLPPDVTVQALASWLMLSIFTFPAALEAADITLMALVLLEALIVL